MGPVRVEVPSAPARKACYDHADGVDLDMAACETAEAAQWEKRLNDAWARLRAALPRGEFAALQEAQRGWLAYRRHECAPDPEGGTSARVTAEA
ncbi:MAG: DUF1311 domain-containing protein [Acetobacteraceae bacterium]|nr:DUF1311 domain-containing protein [Acetobacteraceae bacterium]